jgi:hypothetical protein
VVALRSAVLAVRIALALAGIAACQGPGEEFHEPKITNLGDETIEVYVDTGGVVTKLATVPAGTTVGLSGFNNVCTRDPMVARSLDGEEIARRSEPICPDEFWTIEP